MQPAIKNPRISREGLLSEIFWGKLLASEYEEHSELCTEIQNIIEHLPQGSISGENTELEEVLLSRTN